jgi:cation:H+ antiporter
MLVGGLALTIFAARLLVAGAVGLATDFGISETVIGLTVVAVGTSMPEMVTSLVAARKGQVDVALGNVIGSNIFNILGILGATAVIHPLEIPSAILEVDAWVMLAATLVLGAVALTGWRINRREGLAMAAAYVGYTVYLISRS